MIYIYDDIYIYIVYMCKNCKSHQVAEVQDRRTRKIDHLLYQPPIHLAEPKNWTHAQTYGCCTSILSVRNTSLLVESPGLTHIIYRGEVTLIYMFLTWD